MTQFYFDRQGLARALSISTHMVSRLARQADFPKARAVVGAQDRWLVREVNEWCEKRPEAAVKLKGGKP